MQTSLWKFLLLFCFACSAACAQVPQVASKPAAEALPPRAAPSRPPYYISASAVALEKILAPPPAPPSQAYQDDLQAVLDLQRSRTEADIKESQADAELSPFRFADVLGPEFRADKLPFTTKFLRRVLSDASPCIGAAKNRFDRPRPFTASTEVIPVADKPGGDSYPSGHALYGHVVGTLLALMVPEKSAELFARGARYARNRVVGGVHYPTDIEAGRIAAAVVLNAMLHDEKFLADLEQSRLEVREVLGYK